MRLTESPGTIAVPTSERGNFAMFTVSLAGTLQPAGSNLSLMASASVVENLNAILRYLRPEDEWVWIMGDDHVWQSDTLMGLLEVLDDNPEVDILVPLVVKRNPPWNLVVFHEFGEYDNGLPRWKPWQWDEIPATGIFEIDAAGSAGMLIRRPVIDEIGDPWFENSGSVILNEDVMFCRKARAIGARIFASADHTLGHIGLFNVRPMRRNGRWGAMTEFSSTEEQFRHLFMPEAEEMAAAANGR